MSLDEGHRWHAHTKSEVDWIMDQVATTNATTVVDVGCGDGRHVIEFAGRGLRVTGVDIAQSLLERATNLDTSAEFLHCDARESLPFSDVELAICLYDVLGSSTDESDDARIIQNLAACIRSGGALILSVMNECSIRERLTPDHCPATYEAFIRALDDLPPSRTMQDSGDIHNPSFLVYFEGVYYRKEQFLKPGDRLPREVVVRDRRFSPETVTALLEQNGFDVIQLRPVQAGGWDRTPELPRTDSRAKELLVVCKLR